MSKRTVKKRYVTRLRVARRGLRAEKILEAVTEVTGVSLDDIKSDSRIQDVVNARNLCSYFAKELKPTSLSEFGKLINRHHATVYNGHKRVESFMDVYKSSRIEVDRVKMALGLETSAEEKRTKTELK